MSSEDHSHEAADAEISQQRDRLLRSAAAAARENDLKGGGSDPISNWILGAGAIAMLVAGVVMGHARHPFDYQQFVQPNYVRASISGAGEDGPQPVDALKAYMAKGEKIYTRCGACHGPDGKGGPQYPSLAGSEWAQGETERFSMIILNGLTGPAEDGKTYGIMPSQAAGLSATDLAAVMTFVRNSFGNKTGDIVTVEMAEEAMKISDGRANAGNPVTADELESEHLKNLPGDALDAATMLDPVSLKPAGS